MNICTAKRNSSTEEVIATKILKVIIWNLRLLLDQIISSSACFMVQEKVKSFQINNSPVRNERWRRKERANENEELKRNKAMNSAGGGEK